MSTSIIRTTKFIKHHKSYSNRNNLTIKKNRVLLLQSWNLKDLLRVGASHKPAQRCHTGKDWLPNNHTDQYAVIKPLLRDGVP